MSQAGRRGVTLVEILVVVAVFALLMGVIGAVSVLVQRHQRQARQISEAHRQVGSCIRELATELGFGHHESWTTNGAEGYWFLSSRPGESEERLPGFEVVTGELLWHGWVAIWREPSGEVRRSELRLPGGPEVLAAIDLERRPALLTAFTTLPRRRVLARQISRFQLRLAGLNCQLLLEATTSSAGNPPTRYLVTSSFVMH